MKSETIKTVLTRELFSPVKVGESVLDWTPFYEEGLKIEARREHHVCLMDYHLGERSAVELVREAPESQLSTPMILLTGQGDHDLDVEAMGDANVLSTRRSCE